MVTMAPKVRAICKCLLPDWFHSGIVPEETLNKSAINPVSAHANFFFSSLDALVARFSRSLRRLSATDRLVKTAGVAGYAQCVLVPELAMRLVKLDMSVDDEGARQIMRDSMNIGQRLHPEGNDVVPVAAGFEGITAQSDEDEDEDEEEEEEDELDEDDETGDGEENEHGEHTDDVE